MPGNPHRIRRQTWRIRANSPAQGFQLRQAVREAFAPSFLSAFEAACDESTSVEDVVHIPRFELHLRIPSENHLERLLPEAIRIQLYELLKNRPANDLRKATRRQSGFEALIHYLQTGVLRWEKAGVSVSESTSELKEVCREYLSRLAEHLGHRAEAVPFFFRLLELLSPADAMALADELKRAWPEDWSEAAAQLLYKLFSARGTHFSRHVQVRLAAGFLAEIIAQCRSAVMPDLQSVAGTMVPEESARQFGDFIISLPESARRLFQLEKAAGAPVIPNNGKNAASTQPTATQESEFPLQIHYAGLVLLHPFLPRFFESVGVKNKNQKRLEESSLPRAAALLHWLATGRREILEFELGLVKVLLGLRPESPVCVCGDLVSGADREEADALLQAAIQHWSALKNTSVDGLRRSFLERPALLREDESGWKLQVERLGYDLLLNHLPWGISLVKLPWMTKPIHTEW